MSVNAKKKLPAALNLNQLLVVQTLLSAAMMSGKAVDGKLEKMAGINLKLSEAIAGDISKTDIDHAPLIAELAELGSAEKLTALLGVVDSLASTGEKMKTFAAEQGLNSEEAVKAFLMSKLNGFLSKLPVDVRVDISEVVGTAANELVVPERPEGITEAYWDTHDDEGKIRLVAMHERLLEEREERLEAEAAAKRNGGMRTIGTQQAAA